MAFIGLTLAFFTGMALIEMSITDPTSSFGSRVFGFVCGVILALPGIMLAIAAFAEWKEKKNNKDSKDQNNSSIWKDLLQTCGIIFGVSRKVNENHNSIESLISQFRDSYNDFFQQISIPENSSLQNNVTQLYWHILALQKRRLDQRRVHLQFEGQRIKYYEIPSVSQQSYFDGKYDITEVKEVVKAKKVFLDASGKTLKKESKKQMAWYRLLHAQMKSDKKVICPNCGNETTRENLIDGCDYCGTKFTVEDLGQKVSDFGLRPDYQLEYEKYRNARYFFSLRIGLVVGIFIFLWSSYYAIQASIEQGVGLFMTITAYLISVGFVTGAVIFFALLFFWFCVFPIIQSIASINFFTKKQLEKMKTNGKNDGHIVSLVKVDDKLFSIAGFYSDIQNKLALIHYASLAQEATAFSAKEGTTQIEKYLENYRDVVDMEVENIQLTNYGKDKGMKQISLTADLKLMVYRNNKITKKKETVRLKVEKDQNCKTQAICAPSFFRCQGCGNSLSLIDGKTCHYCGKERNIADIDWAIIDYQVD